MSDFLGEANGFSSDAEKVKTILQKVKFDYQSVLDGFGVSKVNGVLDYSVGAGDYLTDDVVNNIDSEISNIDSIISDIDGRIAAVSKEARRLYDLEQEKLKNQSSTTDGDSSGTGDGNPTGDAE